MKLFLFCLMFFASSLSSAYQYDGDYSGKGEGDLSMTIITLDSEKEVQAVSLGTGSNGCGGGIAGIGSVVGNILKFQNYTKEEGAENCVISVAFKDGKKGKKTATVSEGENCSFFHGMACGFSGTLRQK